MPRRFAVAMIGYVLVSVGILVARFDASAQEKLAPRVKTAVFQSGVNGYDGTVDVELWALAPTTILDTNPNATTDANNDGGESQILLRFERIIGEGRGQIP